MVKAAYCGYPLSLEQVSKAMRLEEKGKLSIGKALIRLFCKPSKKGDRVDPGTRPEDWKEFQRYCINDVVSEREIYRRLQSITIPAWERRNYVLDQEMNDRGVLIDLPFARNAIAFDQRSSTEAYTRLQQITGLENPNSVSQLKDWLSEQLGKEVKELTKDSIKKLLPEVDGDVREALTLRQLLAKSSVKKYIAMENCTGEGSRARGMFQLYGANRTGRWTSKLIQLQSLPQNHMKDLDLARQVVAENDYDLAQMLWPSIPNMLSELIRTAFVAPKGKTFAVADFSAIEARVISWVAQEEWRLDVFRTHGKIYEATAALMFGVPIETVTKGSELRQRGKTSELALGYAGGVDALTRMDREERIPDAEKYIYPQKKYADMTITYFDKTLTSCYEDNHDVNLSVKFELNLNLDVETLLKSFEKYGVHPEHKICDDFYHQEITFDGQEILNNIDFGHIAEQNIPQYEDFFTYYPNWGTDVEGVIQVMLLYMISEKMRG